MALTNCDFRETRCYRARVVRRCTAIVTFVAWCAQARAEAPIVGSRTPRAIGRAGVGTVSDDGGGALVVNPAAIARRDGTRIQLGLSFVDDEMFWLESPSAPAARDQSSSRLLPMVAFEGAIGDWIVGVGAGTSVRSERLLRRPGRIPPSDFGNSFEYRYAGLSGSIRRDTLTAGTAYRLTDSIALGLSVSTSRVEITESRRVWAGDVDRVVLGVPRPDVIGDPAHDVEVAMSAVDNFAPNAVAGILVAPEDSRIELGLSLSWSAPARVDGDISPAGTMPNVEASTNGASARLEVEQPVTVRSGVRWLGEHVVGELGGDLYWFPRRAEATSWIVSGVTIIDTVSPVRESVALVELPSRISSRTHGALRGAFDVELISGFLWATTGYAFTTAGTPRARLSPTFGDLGGHTFALGVEATTGGFTVTVGWSRTWSVKEAEPVSRWQLDNPFGRGDASVLPGTYDGSTDMIGISVDADLDAPD
jgi:Outer membrane protein transport protein (OMPP1/FadL/TodX)